MGPGADARAGEFGRSNTNPIEGDGGYFCARLWCPTGHPFWFHRLGSVGREGPDEHILDLMELVCFGGETRERLFFDMYHEVSLAAPSGLRLGDAGGLGTRVGRVARFPVGLFVLADGKPRRFVEGRAEAVGLTHEQRFLGFPGLLAATTFGTMEER